MLKKRLLILGVLLCALLSVAPQPSRAGAWCSCAATCGSKGGMECPGTICNPDPGTSDAEVAAAKEQCCQDAQAAVEAAGGMSCPATGAGSIPPE